MITRQTTIKQLTVLSSSKGTQFANLHIAS